jgi:hypothetical protein
VRRYSFEFTALFAFMKITRRLLIIVLLGHASAYAYGPTGHQIVGAIADQKLAGTPTGKKIAEMLDGMTLQKASVIADEIKGWDKKGPDAPGIFHYSSRPKIDQQLQAFWRANQPTKDPHSAMPSHHWFHYTDVPVLNPEKYADGKTGRSQWDIVHMMRFCIAVLRGQQSEENERKITKPIAIILLAHYVGDIHQPLHVGAEYFDSNGKPIDPDKGGAALEDEGGNTIIIPFAGSKKKLHGYWDNDTVAALLPAGSGPAPKDERRAANDAALNALVQQLATNEPKNWRLPATLQPNDYPEAWANDILPLAREAHERLQFEGIHPQQQEEQTLAAGTATEKYGAGNDSYAKWSSEVVRDELHKAGWRLADLLEKVLSNSTGPSRDASAVPTSNSPTVNGATPPNATPAMAAPAVAPSNPPPQLATVTKPITLQVPYGSVQLRVGTKLPYTSRGSATIRVRYMNTEYDVPIGSTDVPP